MDSSLQRSDLVMLQCHLRLGHSLRVYSQPWKGSEENRPQVSYITNEENASRDDLLPFLFPISLFLPNNIGYKNSRSKALIVEKRPKLSPSVEVRVC
jgi:hypothetical protein